MAVKDGSREAYFPRIEKRYGEPMSYWFAIMKKISKKKYPEQIAYLKENFGFSQAHANALVMYSRGSTSSRRFDKPSDYFETLTPTQSKTAKAIFKVLQTKFPKLELVMAWNQPMLKYGDAYVFGLTATKKYLLIAPWSQNVLKEFSPRMKDLDVKKKTIGIPSDWSIDSKLLCDMVKARIKEVKP